MPVSAPFRFARISRQVYRPDWGIHISHDFPFEDGLSGRIALKLTAKSPILVGGTRQQQGHVHPYQLPSGHYAIPGSSIQGMIRAILEIVTFAKLGPFVQDRRFSHRDLSSNTVAAAYKARMVSGNGRTRDKAVVPKPKSGWLRRNPDGTVGIVPCSQARVKYAHIPVLAGIRATAVADDVQAFLARTHPYADGPEFPSRDAELRIRHLLENGGSIEARACIEDPDIADHRPHADRRLFLKQVWCRPANAGESTVPGTLVITGKPATGDQQGRKHGEFFFYGPNRAGAAAPRTTISVPEDVWRDFLLIHEPKSGRNAEVNSNWSYWRPAFGCGKPVPVFYLVEDGAITAIGTTSMFKLAMQVSTHAALANSSPDHIASFDPEANRDWDSDPAALDLPSLIFGCIGGKKGDANRVSLARRASFDTALAAGTPEPDANGIGMALLSPKPSFYPFYVRQAAGQDSFKSLYDADAELAGTKIWPAIIGRATLRQQEAAGEVVSTLHTLPAETVFQTTLRFHNLKPAELGAILWALTFGEPGQTERVHRLGGGKPGGFGQVLVELGDLQIDGRQSVQDCLDAFANVIGPWFSRAVGDGAAWEASAQVAAVKQAALGIEPATALYMRLSVDPHINNFADIKKGPKGISVELMSSAGHEGVRAARSARPGIANPVAVPGGQARAATALRTVRSANGVAYRFALGDRVVDRNDRHGTIAGFPRGSQKTPAQMQWQVRTDQGAIMEIVDQNLRKAPLAKP